MILWFRVSGKPFEFIRFLGKSSLSFLCFFGQVKVEFIAFKKIISIFIKVFLLIYCTLMTHKTNSNMFDIKMSKWWVYIMRLHHFDKTAVLYWEWMSAVSRHFSWTRYNHAMIVSWFNSSLHEVPDNHHKQRVSQFRLPAEIAKMHFFSLLQLQLQAQAPKWSIELRKWKSNYYWLSFINEK